MKRDETVGRRLKKARLEAGLSIDDIYKKTRIHPRVLGSLEQEDADASLGEIYIKAFLRKYAAFLGFDPEKIISDYAAEHPAFVRLQKTGFTEIEREKKRSLVITAKLEKPLMAACALAIAAILSLIIFSVFHLRQGSGEKEAASPAALAEKKEAAIEEPSSFIPANEPLSLRLETTDEVWLRLTSDGKRIFEKVLPGGTVKELQAQERFEIWVGRAEAIRLTLNGRPLGKPGRGLIKSIVIDHNGLNVQKR